MKARRLASLLLNILALSLPACTLVPARAADEPQAATVPGELLVGIDPKIEATPAGIDVVAAQVGVIAGYHRDLHILRLKLRPGLSAQQAIWQLRRRNGVLFAEPNHLCRLCVTPNDPLYPKQYGPQKTQADLSWGIWTPAQQAVIAILDTGIDTTHPDLTDVLDRDSMGNVIGDNTLTGTSDVTDDNGHGTECAGIAAAHIDNGIGIAGVAGFNPTISGSDTYIKIMPVKVLNAGGSGTDAEVASGITWAADHGANVISMSLGENTYSQTLDMAVQYAWSKGCVIVAAAGNESRSALFYPAAFNHVISVAATDKNDNLTSFSQYGSWVEVAAPGNSILSTLPTYVTHNPKNVNYGTFSGTSLAAPHVSGEAAAIVAQNPTLTNAEVATLILANVDAYTPYADRFIAANSGRINIYRAVQAAGDGTPILTALALAVPKVAGSVTVTATAFLGGHAPPEGANIACSSSDPIHAPVSQNVTIAPGASSVSFDIATTQVTATTPITITTVYNGVTVTSTLTLTPIALYSLVFLPGRVVGGQTTNGILTLNAPAPAGGETITLTSADPITAPVPASITIPEGSASAGFSVTTGVVSVAETVRVTATFGNQTTKASLSVQP